MYRDIVRRNQNCYYHIINIKRFPLHYNHNYIFFFSEEVAHYLQMRQLSNTDKIIKKRKSNVINKYKISTSSKKQKTNDNNTNKLLIQAVPGDIDKASLFTTFNFDIDWK